MGKLVQSSLAGMKDEKQDTPRPICKNMIDFPQHFALIYSVSHQQTSITYLSISLATLPKKFIFQRCANASF